MAPLAKAHGNNPALGGNAAQRRVEGSATDRIVDHVGATPAGELEYLGAQILGAIIDQMIGAGRLVW